MKRFLITTGALLLCIQSFAYDFEDNGLYYNILSETDKTCEVTYNNEDSVKSYSGTIVIPNTANGYSVVSIGNNAFSGCSGLTSLSIPKSVSSIGKNAANRCPELRTIVVDSGNPYFDSRDNCNAIIETASNALVLGCQNSAIPDGIAVIEADAFYGCIGLMSISIPSSVTSIKRDAFFGCSGLTRIIVDSGNPYYDSRDNCNAIIESASDSLFVGCQTTVIPNTVKKIAGSAFGECKGLTNINIPNSVTMIGSGAFYCCTDLVSITISNNVSTIQNFTFWWCTSLAEVLIPDGVITIKKNVFDNCISLTSIIIPSTVTSIGGYAFRGCCNLTNVTVLSTIPPSIKGSTFMVKDTLHVLPGCGDSYRAADTWKDFAVILEDAGGLTDIHQLKSPDTICPCFNISGQSVSMPFNPSIYVRDKKKILVR